MPITNVYMDGDYTGALSIGSQKKLVNVILDTGSSTFAVAKTKYDPTKDTSAKITSLAQEVSYADRSDWIGAVISTKVSAGSGSQSVSLPQVDVAVAYHESESMFQGSDGILGLAYTRLNNAFEMPGPTIPPRYTYNQIQAGKMTYIEPYFTKLESAGLVANKFAFHARRSLVNVLTDDPASDPLNQGFLILGGGEEDTDLYDGSFQVARVLHDTYYNTNLKSVVVENSAPIPVLPPTKASGNSSNSMVDSGTNSLSLDQPLFDKILSRLSGKYADQLRASYVKMGDLDLPSWPTIKFVLEGALGSDVELVVTPETYWQTNAPKKGYASAVLFGGGGGQSILGLPLLNNYFTIFDRSVDRGLGVVSFALIH